MRDLKPDLAPGLAPKAKGNPCAISHGLHAVLIVVAVGLALGGSRITHADEATAQGTQTAPLKQASPMVKQASPLAQNPALEARVMVIAEELRCLVCQNETIAASHADLAIDLRKQIRIKLTQGQTQQQILDFMVERYGDFVLYRPPLKATTVLLWAGPFALLAVAVMVLLLNIRRRRLAEQPTALSPEEILRAQKLLGGDALTIKGNNKLGSSKP